MTPPVDPTALTALAEKLEEARPHLWVNPAAPVVDEAIATLRALASPATPATEGQNRFIYDVCDKCGVMNPCPAHPKAAEGQGHAATPADWPARGDCTCEWVRYEEMSQRDPTCPRHKDAPDPPAALDREALVKAKAEAEAERDAARAELATVTAERDGLRFVHARSHEAAMQAAKAEGAREALEQAAAELQHPRTLFGAECNEGVNFAVDWLRTRAAADTGAR